MAASKFFVYSLFLFYLYFGWQRNSCLLFAESRQDATLVITFKTGSAGERLNRVRFWLRDEKGLPKLYPRSKGYISDPEGLSKKVVIDHLPAGRYTLQFIYPNRDEFFENLPLRELELKPDTVMKIDQVIRPRYASITASATGVDQNKVTIELVNSKGEAVVNSLNGRLEANLLTPDTYHLHFANIAGYKTPNPIAISLRAGEQVNNVQGEYQRLPDTLTKQAIAFIEQDHTTNPLLLDSLPLPSFSTRYYRVNQSNRLVMNPAPLFPKVPITAPLLGKAVFERPCIGKFVQRCELDAFSKAFHEVNNRHFACWLNRLSSEGSLVYDEKGLLFASDGTFLGKTAAARSGSKIVAFKDEKVGSWRFAPIDGTELEPVAEVSWIGVDNFCKAQEGRQPPGVGLEI